MDETILDLVYSRKCDWDDPDDVRVHRKIIRREKRESLLAELVPDRMCPGCHEVRPSSRQWIVSLDEEVVICRSCYHRAKEEVSLQDIGEEIFTEELRFIIDGRRLARLRNISIREFAKRAGWTHTYQIRLESKVASVDSDVASTILEVLRSCGIVTKDCL